MTRKRVEVQDAPSRNPMVRVCTYDMTHDELSHTVSGQVSDPVNFETGKGIPAWSFKVKGRLLELLNQWPRDKVVPRKFSTFIKEMVVELVRDPILYPDGNIMECPRAQGTQPALDGFMIRRTGDQPTRTRIIIHLEHTPEQYKEMFSVSKKSRIGVIQTLGNYIKIYGLRDEIDRRRIKTDDHLRPILGSDTVLFQQFTELVNRYLIQPDPVILHYTINPMVPPPEHPQVCNIEVKMEHTGLKNRMAVTAQAAKDSTQDLSKLDDEIALLTRSLHNAHTTRLSLQSYAEDPVMFVQCRPESQSRDLESILGSGPSEGATIRAEELRRSDFFRLPWVEEAVTIQESMRLSSKQ
ncbi:hypothetical protein EDC04DRAFT_2867563 [Pisolithus marmoratus]|nr:hypothetical protein EDC04DRAFT_2867563 [Pisolithus marmoratus]